MEGNLQTFGQRTAVSIRDPPLRQPDAGGSGGILSEQVAVAVAHNK